MEKGKSVDVVQVLILLGLFLALLFLWNTIFVYPVKIFVVLLHELGHGFAAVITGGSMNRIEISPDQGGVCWSTGGLRLLIVPFGYLGSMIFGGIILVLASRSKIDKLLSIAIGAIVIAMTLFVVRNPFGFVFGLAFGAGLVAVGLFVPGFVNDVILKFLGLSSVLYAVIDIKDDLIARSVPGSDAYAMSEMIPLPPVVWGVIWIAMAVVAAFFFLKNAAVRESRDPA